MTIETGHRWPRVGASPDRSVRAALPTDAQDVARVHRAALAGLIRGVGVPDSNLPSTEEVVRAWRHTLGGPRPEGCHTLVAVHGHGVAGFASCAPVGASEPPPGRGEPVPGGTEILNLWVDAAFGRSGHGSRLLAAVAEVSGAQCLRVWIAAGDQERIRFFQGAGFGPAGLRRAHRVGEGEGDVLVEHLWWSIREGQ
ncbi:GNAT family N-acetyltransferase [Schaalia sp. 19OD2882]|uniref:GNAT family N-acetyltransferase n=1 Tax=Schaalia sp. 19OD2882 TaxID=2794089 RepID=UPI001C1EE57B|nr:GNAT family N-acetyltransferase [Schaalia sp. 19OD2882]QWW18981.1 GNAT family N-acetyltransferase [Schaalia sp. 19OD2882]